ncbi:TPA: hypothetical protein QCX65_004458 [Bacillus mycoides]|uniref:hypothetical protein n=1 Tax=Bacillus mycoides TaxID=1405 RepID=UPI002E207FA2|nr:hypothetical protein [Bacillus mycoides]HDR7601017.1 hypothetical protein [Bacillus mycoides]
MTKEDILRIVVSRLEQAPYTQLASLRNAVKEKVAPQTRVDKKTALLTNEVIYDLLYGRVITPGMDEHNLDLPWIHVSSPEKLAEIKEKLKQEV